MTLTLTRRDSDPIPVDLRGLCPLALRGASLDQIRSQSIRWGNRPVDLCELGDVTGDPADGRWRLCGDWSTVHSIGAGLDGGEIVVEGDVGRHAGEGMRGGSLVIHGNAGDWLAAEMHGGLVRVRGNAGNYVGAALPGSRRGMTGGTILVDGNVGDFAACRMRRGLLAVGGSAGEWLGRQMLAGTVLAWGPCGQHVGSAMRRGTIGLFGAAPAIAPTFQRGGIARWPMLSLLRRELGELAFPRTVPDAPLQIIHGDFLHRGRGELLVAP